LGNGLKFLTVIGNLAALSYYAPRII